jgi:CPA1 family monovalent cation:H+ antiporter
MVEGFELVLVLVVIIGIVVTVSRRVHAPWPVLLVLAGLALTLLPQFGHVDISPDLVLTVFLPPLLFGAAWYTPVQDFRRYRRAIVLLSVGLVLFTTLVVAYTADLLIAGLPLAAAFALGAIVAPPDAISAIAVLRPLAVPRRMLSILEGESLVNDATALTAFSVSVAAVTTGVFEPGQAVLDFLWVLVIGILVGVVVAIVAGWIWSRLSDPPVEVSLSLVIPYLAYLPAEQLHGSGVIAAVTAGLLLGYKQARILSSDARLLGTSVWEWVTYTLNGFAFIIIGLELPTVLEAVRDRPTEELLLWAVAVSAAVILARFAWVIPGTYLPRLLPRIGDQEPPIAFRNVVIVSWAGMRGAVSLAAALALPFGFPERDLLIFLAFCVILVTLVGQGLTLEPLIKALHVEAGNEVTREEEAARRTSTQAALDELERLRGVWPDHLPLIDRLADQFHHRMEHLSEDGEASEVEQERLEHRSILGSVLKAERTAVADMRERGEIDDGVLRAMERELDLEELRLSAET